MKLYPATITFGDGFFEMAAVGTEFAVRGTPTMEGKLPRIKVDVIPASLEVDDAELPDEVDMLIATVCLFGEALQDFVHVPDPVERNVLRIGISKLFDQLERGKIKFPQASEHTLLVQIIATVSKLEPSFVHASGLARKEVESLPTEAEQELILAVNAGVSEDELRLMNCTEDIHLDHQTTTPVLTPEDLELLNAPTLH